MSRRRTLTRWFAAVLSVGALLTGAAAPTQAAEPTRIVGPQYDTGWNGT